ncbi:hypothetical protein ANN_00515 [Periplaneta americana]|uniref:Uncharacterized protein n=1 Tax=Periplaneta americana TaxID=6978 RepID=A0ABQ8TTX6_PERAM|nr:hypothetical protein ANN_00515 [Periplaneta americana]
MTFHFPIPKKPAREGPRPTSRLLASRPHAGAEVDDHPTRMEFPYSEAILNILVQQYTETTYLQDYVYERRVVRLGHQDIIEGRDIIDMGLVPQRPCIVIEQFTVFYDHRNVLRQIPGYPIKKGLPSSEYINVVKMSCNLSAVRSVPSRAVNTTRCCHLGCDETETLGHVLGFCREIELLWNNHHHRVRIMLADILRQQGLEVHEEVHCILKMIQQDEVE